MLAGIARPPTRPLAVRLRGWVTWETALNEALRAVSAVIAKQDTIADQFAREQERLRAAARLHLLAPSKAKYDQLVSDDTASEAALRACDIELTEVKKEHSDLQAKMRDHALAAEPINAAIANFLRHKEIQIEPVEKGYLLKRADGHLTPSIRYMYGRRPRGARVRR